MTLTAKGDYSFLFMLSTLSFSSFFMLFMISFLDSYSFPSTFSSLLSYYFDYFVMLHPEIHIHFRSYFLLYVLFISSCYSLFFLHSLPTLRSHLHQYFCTVHVLNICVITCTSVLFHTSAWCMYLFWAQFVFYIFIAWLNCFLFC